MAGITRSLCLGQSASSVVVVVAVVSPAVGHTYAVTYAQIEFARATSAKLRERDKAGQGSLVTAERLRPDATANTGKSF